MSGIRQDDLRNRLLRALPANEFALLQPALSLIPVALRQVMFAARQKIETLFFPETAVISITSPGETVEVGLIGHEGVVGASPVLLACESTPYPHFVQIAGDVLAVNIVDFRAALHRSPVLHSLTLRFVYSLLVQTAHTAFVNATHQIERRLARWLLMCQDRIDGNDVRLTHAFLSMMLAVQRPSVTLALQMLEGQGLIKARRGRITVLDRQRLMRVAGEGYGLAEAEYARQLGDVLEKPIVPDSGSSRAERHHGSPDAAENPTKPPHA